MLVLDVQTIRLQNCGLEFVPGALRTGHDLSLAFGRAERPAALDFCPFGPRSRYAAVEDQRRYVCPRGLTILSRRQATGQRESQRLYKALGHKVLAHRASLECHESIGLRACLF